MIRASINITALSAVVSLTSFMSQLAIAHAFGAGYAYDSYLLAASVPSVAGGLLSAAMNFSLLPELVRLTPERPAFRIFAARLLLHLGLLMLILIVAGWVSTPWLLAALGEAAAGAGAEAVQMMRMSWIGSALLVVAGYLGLILTALKRFYWPVAVSSFPYLAIVLIMLTLAPSRGVVALPAAMILGAAASCLLLALKIAPELHFHGSKVEVAPRIKNYYGGMLWALAAMSCFSTSAIIDAIWAPQVGAGTLSTLGYGQRVLIAVGGLMIVGPASLLVSSMFEVGVESGEGAVRIHLLHTAKVTLVLGAAVSTVLGALAHPVVELVFERGRFDATATSKLSDLLPILLTGMPPMLASVILLRGMFQLGLRRTAAFLGASWTGAYALFCAALSPISGAQGMAGAYSISWWLIFVAGLVIVLASRWREHASSWLAIAAVGVVSSLAAGLLINRTQQYFSDIDDNGTLMSFGLIILQAGVGMAAFATTYVALNVLPALRASTLWAGPKMPRGERERG